MIEMNNVEYWLSGQRTFAVRPYGIMINVTLAGDIQDRDWRTMRIGKVDVESEKGLALIITEGDENDIRVPNTYGIKLTRKSLDKWLKSQGCPYGQWPAKWTQLPDGREAVIIEIADHGIEDWWEK